MSATTDSNSNGMTCDGGTRDCGGAGEIIERPILFSAPMVRAILEGRKTQTRRVVKPQPQSREIIRCPYGKPGDRLWVKETFQFVHANSDGQRRTFKSSVPFTTNDYRWIEYAATPRADEPAPVWKPSIYMPRWASRITLEIVGVRVERAQEITEEDALAEGVFGDECFNLKGPVFADQGTPKMCYTNLWDSINAKRGFGWSVNPWVWAIQFRRIKP